MDIIPQFTRCHVIYIWYFIVYNVIFRTYCRYFSGKLCKYNGVQLFLAAHWNQIIFTL